MNKLISEVCRVLDFPLEYYDLAIKEAFHKEKLRNTYMFVNGKLKYIGDYDLDVGSIYSDGEQVVVESLEPWVPVIGLYEYKNSVVFVSKKVHKHWQKSFNPAHYTLRYILVSKEIPYDVLATLEPKSILVAGGVVYYYDKVIGYLDEPYIKCTKPEFYQELIDYSNRRNLGWNVQL